MGSCAYCNADMPGFVPSLLECIGTFCMQIQVCMLDKPFGDSCLEHGESVNGDYMCFLNT